MRKPLFALLLSMLVFFLFQTSCEKRTISPRGTHWDAVKAIISQYPDIFRLGFYDTEPDTFLYREITYSDADIEEGRLFEADSLHRFCDYYITLVWGDSLKGKFHYRFNGEPYEKQFSSIAKTNAYFEKLGGDYLDRGWSLKQFSGTVISSVPTTRTLEALDIVSDGVDTTTYDESTLLELVKKKNILVFGMGKPVTFTIYVPITDTSDFFFLHVKEGQTYQKIPFTNNGDGTLSASWTTTVDPDPAKRYYHAIVDVVSRESVADTLAEYDSKAWGIIYQIK